MLSSTRRNTEQNRFRSSALLDSVLFCPGLYGNAALWMEFSWLRIKKCSCFVPTVLNAYRLSPFVTRLLSLSPHLSPSQNIGNWECRSLTSSLWAFTSIFHMHYETLLIKLQVYTMTRPPSICNKCLFFSLQFPHILSSQGAGDWMNQTLCLFQSPRCFIYRGKSTLTPLHSLWKIYQALFRLSYCLSRIVILEVQMRVVGQCNISVCWSAMCFHLSTLATVLHAHAVTWPALLSRHL